MTTRTTHAQKGGNLTLAIPLDQFDRATIKLDGAKALVSTMGMLLGGGGTEMPDADMINSAMSGIEQLIESAVTDLLATDGGVA